MAKKILGFLFLAFFLVEVWEPSDSFVRAYYFTWSEIFAVKSAPAQTADSKNIKSDMVVRVKAFNHRSTDRIIYRFVNQNKFLEQLIYEEQMGPAPVYISSLKRPPIRI